tara:strand:+ start:965 stop:2119 length:1155 start_codon:yes stop_codon:yes gene_type:complete
MITPGIFFKNFRVRGQNFKIKKILKNLIQEDNHILQSLTKGYKDRFKKQNYKFFKKLKNLRIIGIGGSSLGAKTICSFLENKIGKNVSFLDNLTTVDKKIQNRKHLNLIISKSGNTLETIVNSNIFLKKGDKNIFITENKKNYLNLLAQKLKAEIVYHNNFIGGRYSVLSEAGMLPAELMGLKSKNFRQLNNLIKNQKYLNALISNVSSTVYLIKKKKFNSIIINYDEKSQDLFSWYQQLVAESLGKKGKGLLPFVSNMPRDNHSVMQLYLDGFKNNFYTFFYVHENNSTKINNKTILASQNFLKNKTIRNITYAQKKATENVFRKKNIPFRSFEINRRDEKTLGELFCFFILETILIGRALDINPYNQPAVELIKRETRKILV